MKPERPKTRQKEMIRTVDRRPEGGWRAWKNLGEEGIVGIGGGGDWRG